MNKALYLFVFLGLVSCNSNSDDASHEHEQTAYDPVVAKMYGADEYGMNTFVMAFLYEGATREEDPLKADA
jgi:hypothetical protein